MAMTPAQRTAELQRKKNLGIAPTDSRNNAEYNKLTAMPPAAVTAANNFKSGMTAPSVDPKITNAAKTMASKFSGNQFEFKAPTPFTYDQNSDPAYKAAIASAKANIAQQQSDTNARLRATGQGKSSYSETVANQIGAKEMGRVATDVLPQLISQAYQRYSDTANRDLQVQQANYGVGRDLVGDSFTEAELTGNYLPQAARQAIDNLNSLKADTEQNWQSMTPQEREGARMEGDRLRAFLQANGIDSNLFGADVKSTNAIENVGRAGLTTLAKQNQDFNQAATTRQLDRDDEQRKFDNDITMAQLSGVLPNGQPTTAEQQRQITNQWMAAQQTGVIPNVLADMYGIKRGTRTQDAIAQAENIAQGWAQTAISQQNANTSAANAALSRDEFAYRKEQDQIEQAANSGSISEEMKNEAIGMVEAIRSGGMSAANAYTRIDEDLALGFYDPATANYLKSTLERIAPSQPEPELNEAQQEQKNSLPSNDEIDKIWKTEGQGTPMLDFRAWYKSPKGRLGGVDFNTWNRLYGPKLGG